MSIAVLIGAAVPAHATEATRIIDGAVGGFIRPAYADLASSTQGLSTAVEALCASPSQHNLGMAREHFIASADAFSRVEAIRIGPINEGNRLERLLFWPDRKGTGLRQVQAVLAKKNPDDARSENLADKSVAIQGFGALEFVLYGTGAETLTGKDDPFRCAYGKAVAGNMAAIAAAVSADWSKPGSFADRWMSPGPENPQYRNGVEAVSELVAIFVDGLEVIRDVRVNGFLAESAGALRADMEGLKELFDASHLADSLPADKAYIADSIDFEFSNAINAAAEAQGPLDKVLADTKRRGKLGYFKLVTTSLSDLFATQLSGAFGLTTGFSSLDGD